MTSRSTTLLVVFMAGAMVACSEQNDLVGARRKTTGTPASLSGGTVPPSGPSADLQISGSASTGSPFTDSLFAYTYQIKNAGPDSVLDVTFVDTLPPSLTFWGIDLVGVPGLPACGETMTAATVVVSCNLGALKKGASVSPQLFVYAPDSAGPVSNTAHTLSSIADPAPTNNSVTISVQAQIPRPGKVPAPAPVAATAFTTLPADPDGGYVFAGGPSGVGFQFIPTVTGTLTELLTATQASGGGRSEFWIYNDDPLNPDHVGTLLFGPFFGTIPSVFSLDAVTFPKGGPPLVAGQKYWLFGFGATGELSGLWHYSSNVLATTPCAVGPFPGIGGYGTCRYPAFEVIVLH